MRRSPLPIRSIAMAAALAFAACERAPAPSEAPAPAAPQPAPAPQANPEDGRTWNYSRGADPKLTYGVPQTDDVTIALRCAEDSLRVSFIRPRAQVDGLEAFELSTDGARTRLPARTEPTMMGGDALMVHGEIAPDDPVVLGLRRTGRLVLQAGDQPVAMSAGPGEAAQVAAFLDSCR